MLESDTLAKIWGRWCGPNWTGGKNVSAQDYKGSWFARCNDDLDCACRTHDQACSGDNGCSRASDDRLLAVARKISANPWNRLFAKNKAKAADKVVAAISLARVTRKH